MNIKIDSNEVTELKKLLNLVVKNKLEGVDISVLKDLIHRIEDSNSIKLFVDGASDLKNKIAGIGGVFYRNSEELYSFSKFIGNATNNEAEYGALIKGIEISLKLKLLTINIFADSELVVKQIKGEYKVKNERMQKLHARTTILLNKLNSWSISHIPREENSVADKLSKEGMKSN